jgi:hypothetical protein
MQKLLNNWYGIGKAEAFYHIALGVEVISMGVSGFILFCAPGHTPESRSAQDG